MTSDQIDVPRRRYPSDISNDRWLALSPLIPQAKTVGRPRERSVREIVDAINYHWETGCAWRMLPHDFPPWGTVYSYFRKWQRTGVLQHLREELLRPERPRKSSRRQPEFAPGDFQNPNHAGAKRTHQLSAEELASPTVETSIPGRSPRTFRGNAERFAAVDGDHGTGD